MSEAENDAAWVAKLIITERDATITALREEVAQARKAAAEALYGEGNDPGYPLPEMIEALKVLAQNGIALTALRQRVERAEAALLEIAKQKTMDELSADAPVDAADFVGAYDACVTTARTALAALEQRE